MAANVAGALILIAIVLPWFLIAVAVCAVLYAMVSMYYRASAVEIQVRTSSLIVNRMHHN